MCPSFIQLVFPIFTNKKIEISTSGSMIHYMALVYITIFFTNINMMVGIIHMEMYVEDCRKINICIVCIKNLP